MWWTWLACAETVEGVLARDADVDAGAEVFAAVCAECHGADGTGGEGTNLTNDDNTREELAHKVLLGYGTMDGWADELTEQDVADVVEYVFLVLQSDPPTARRAPFAY